MRHPIALPVAAALAGLMAAPVHAQEVPACDRFAWSLRREQAAFAEPGLPVLRSGSALPAGATAASLELRPAAEVSLPFPPERPPGPETRAGFLRLPAVPAGLYQVTVSDEAWIDVGQEGTVPLRSVGQSGQRGCASVRKSLRFQLGAAPVTIQVSGAATERIAVSLLRAD